MPPRNTLADNLMAKLFVAIQKHQVSTVSCSQAQNSADMSVWSSIVLTEAFCANDNGTAGLDGGYDVSHGNFDRIHDSHLETAFGKHVCYGLWLLVKYNYFHSVKELEICCHNRTLPRPGQIGLKNYQNPVS